VEEKKQGTVVEVKRKKDLPNRRDPQGEKGHAKKKNIPNNTGTRVEKPEKL